MNQDLWSILLLTTSGSASNNVKKFEGTKPKDGTGDSHAAWQALNEKCNSRTKEARRACHEKLVNTKMESGQDPDDLFFALNGCRDLLEKMAQTVHYERCKDIILQALPAEYERVRNTSYEKRDLELVDIQHCFGSHLLLYSKPRGYRSRQLVTHEIIAFPYCNWGLVYFSGYRTTLY